MKLLLESWQEYLNEDSKIYYWQTRGVWSRAEDPIGQHVPRAVPFHKELEEIFEKERLEVNPEAPSRLNCVYLCKNLKGFAGNSFCRDEDTDFMGKPIETYEIQLRGDYQIFKANAEMWTEASIRYEHDPDASRRYARAYWQGETWSGSIDEILVSPPEAAIIVGKNETST